MQRPGGLVTWAIFFLLTCLLCACAAGGEGEPPRASERSEDESTGEGSRAPAELTWGPVERLAGKWGTRAATTMAPDGTATVMWVGPHSALSREASPGMPWKPGEPMPHTTETTNIIADVDAHGTVTAVWDHNDWRSARYSFWSARHPAGGSWSRPVELGGGPEGDVGWQGWDLAVNPSGAAVFAWGPEYGPVRARYLPANGVWAPLTSMPRATWPATPIVTIDPDGLATVAYLRDNPGLLTLVQGSAAGWEEPAKMGTPLGLRPYEIDAAAGGEVVVAWQEADLSLMTGRFREGNMTGQQPLTETQEPSIEIQVAASPDGSARFVWMPGDPENPGNEMPGGAKPEDVHSVYQSVSGKLGDPEVIGTTGPCGTTETFATAMERNERGDTIIGWSGADPSGMDLAYRGSGTEAWSPQDGAVPDGSGPTCWAAPTVALAENSSALVTWENFHSNVNTFEATELLARRATTSR